MPLFGLEGFFGGGIHSLKSAISSGYMTMKFGLLPALVGGEITGALVGAALPPMGALVGESSDITQSVGMLNDPESPT